jgi:hypothetical protein
MYNNDVGKESAQKFMKQTGDPYLNPKPNKENATPITLNPKPNKGKHNTCG